MNLEKAAFAPAEITGVLSDACAVAMRPATGRLSDERLAMVGRLTGPVMEAVTIALSHLTSQEVVLLFCGAALVTHKAHCCAPPKPEVS